MSTSTTNPSTTHPLTPLDPNTTSPSKPSTTTTTSDAKPAPSAAAAAAGQSLDYHRQVLQSRLSAENGDGKAYVSPSDTIMSPCTAKLSAYKGKKFARAKGQTLFGKMGGVKAGEEGAAGA